MARKSEEAVITLNKAQYAEIMGLLKIAENVSKDMYNATKTLIKDMEARHGAPIPRMPPPGMRRAGEPVRTMPLKSSLATRKSSQKVSKRKNAPPKTLRFMLPVRPPKSSDKAKEKTDSKGHAKSSDKKR